MELDFEGWCEFSEVEGSEEDSRGRGEGSCVSEGPEKDWGVCPLQQQRRKGKACSWLP